MADKRISQLVDRGTIANNDVVPIVVSGASTTNKATISSIQTFMQGNLDMGVTSVGLSMPSAFVVSNSPVTASGNISVTGAGTVSQYIRGDGSLADFPSGGGGGGSSVNYYLNGSVSQGTIGGIAYQEMNRTPILGAGTDFTIAADGYIASFITDAGDPALLEIPAGNWNFETYLQASSGGGTPSFYIELYKVDSGGTATLIASNSGTPELIAFGTTTTPYFSALAVPTTSLALTDRLALRYYVTHSGRTITLHTENATLCQIITTFTTGLTALNGLTAQVQNFATGTSGTDFGISSSVSTHTFNLPTASATNRGALSSADWTTFNNKQAAGNYVTTDTTQSISGVKTFTGGALRISSGGLGGLPTRIVNAPVSSVALSGFNSIGFNGSNNLFITRETDTNGVILAFNNTDLRTYTLPNVSGTIALTSDLSSGYVPYSGAAANVDLGVNTLTSSSVILNGSGSNSGIIHLESNAIHSLVNGYGSIASGTTNQFNLYQTTGAGVFRGAILSLNSITASATRTYTLPDADGTLALSTDLGSYLPLTGGTLTGALNGTSASFTGDITASSNAFFGTFNGNDKYHFEPFTNSAGGANNAYFVSGKIDNNERSGFVFQARNSNGDEYNALIVEGYNSTSTTPALTIASTGAATFSSSVGIGGTNTDSLFTINGTAGTSHQRFREGSTTLGFVGGANGIITGHNGKLAVRAESGLVLSGSGNSPDFIIASGGAATFSSSLGIAITPSGNDGVFQTNGSLGNLGGGTAKRAATIFSTSAENADRPGIILGYDTAGGGIIAAATQSSGQPLNFWTYNGSSWGERMRITSGGKVGINTDATGAYLDGKLSIFGNSTIPAATLKSSGDGGQFTMSVWNAASVGGSLVLIQFVYGSSPTAVGSITSNGTTTAYNTTSDYRLKEDLKELKGLEKVLALKVYDYKWKSEDSRMDGVLAHELAEVLPYAVYGEKDEVDENGIEKMQGVDYSKIVPVLIKAIQELKTEIDSLKNQMQ